MADAGERVQLVVQGDDFGMCHAVNEGIRRVFTDGILTEASTMCACPWFFEAAEIGLELGIPMGVHQTLTCEWDYLRWPPITDGASLVGDDRTFHRTVEAASACTVDDAVAELSAQVDRFQSAGLKLTYLDVHMGYVSVPAYDAVSKKYGAPFLYPGIDASLSFTSIKGLSDRQGDKKAWMLGYLESLASQPGVHLLVCHPGLPGEELSSITGPSSPPYRWAEEYRASDVAVLTDPDVRAAVERHGIELVSVSTAAFA